MRRVLSLVAVLCLAFAPAPVDKPKPDGKTDLERLRGEWVLASESLGGVPQARRMRWVFDGRLLELTDAHGTSRWEVALDEKSSPKALDLLAKVRGRLQTVYRAVYTLEDNTLCVYYDAEYRLIRPAGLPPEKANTCVWTFRRKRP